MKIVTNMVFRFRTLALATSAALTLFGCITAFTPARDFCTLDAKDTSIRQCKPDPS